MELQMGIQMERQMEQQHKFQRKVNEMLIYRYIYTVVYTIQYFLRKQSVLWFSVTLYSYEWCFHNIPDFQIIDLCIFDIYYYYYCYWTCTCSLAVGMNYQILKEGFSFFSLCVCLSVHSFDRLDPRTWVKTKFAF